MPQIDAPTVAEHRAQQREALLDAAEAILLEDGHGALTFRALGERTGLARNSIYRYFALARRPDRRAVRARHAALAAGARDGDGGRRRRRTRASPRSSPRSCGSSPHGSHRLAELLGDAPLGPAVRARINALAYRPAALLGAELGTRTPQLAAQLVQGVVNAGVRLLHGAVRSPRSSR